MVTLRGLLRRIRKIEARLEILEEPYNTQVIGFAAASKEEAEEDEEESERTRCKTN